MVVTTDTELLAGFKSFSLAPTVATLVMVPLVTPCGMAVVATATTLVTVALAPTFRPPRLPMTLVGVVSRFPCDAAAETKVTPAGRRLVKATDEAVFRSEEHTSELQSPMY